MDVAALAGAEVAVIAQVLAVDVGQPGQAAGILQQRVIDALLAVVQAIEQTVNSITPFNTPATQIVSTTTLSGTDPFKIYAVPNGVNITVGARTCLFSAPATGYSAVSTIAPEDNLWEFRVTVLDDFTKASAAMVQGVKIRQLAGSCP